MLTYTEAKPKYNAGIFLMLRSQLTIKPGVKNVHGDMNCEVKDKITMFAFRTHAHTLGAVITGFRVRDGEFEEVARGDPQRPQTFYPMPKFQVAQKGDIMVARCTFDGTRTNKTTRIGNVSPRNLRPWGHCLMYEFTPAGMTAGDEMCNLYIMYYSDRENDDFRICVDEEVSGLSGNIPANSDDRFPPFHEEDDSVSYANGAAAKSPATKKGYHSRPSRIRTFIGYPQPPPSNFGYGFPQAYAPQQQQPVPLPQYPQMQQPSYGYQQPLMPPPQPQFGYNANLDPRNFGGGGFVGQQQQQREQEPATEGVAVTSDAPLTTAKSKTRPRRPVASIHGVQGATCLCMPSPIPFHFWFSLLIDM